MADDPKSAPQSLLLPLGIIAALLIGGIYNWYQTGGPDSKPGLFTTSTPLLSGTRLPRSGDSRPDSSNGPAVNSSTNKTIVDNPAPISATTSRYADMIQLYRGTAGNSLNTYNKEYVELRAGIKNTESINITGWRLRNGLGDKNFEVSGRVVRGVAQELVIPQGALIFNGSKPSALGNIVMNPGDRAYLVTGAFVNTTPFPVRVSFKTNKCSGYMKNYPGWTFYPALSTSACPRARDEQGVSSLSDVCNKFVSGFSACHVPVLKEYDRNGDRVNLVDNRSITSACRTFINNHFGYDQCLNYHLADPDFLGKEWRIFLNYRGVGFWQKTRETMYLIDQYGKIVDTVKYGF